ncbi:MAG: hypothetical protein JW807_17805 [Spirochaetes bacterium]|nr:hypothetical protein [Spirochaetota bacterium]
MAIASLVLGIISIMFAFTGPFSFIGIILGVIGIVLGAIARKKEPDNTLSTGGLVTSIVGCAIALVFNLACIACISGGKKAFDEVSKDPQIRKSFDDFTKGMKELEKKANEEAAKKGI